MKKMLAGWGNLPVESCHVTVPASVGELRRVISDDEISTQICRGLGRSYGDAAINRDGGVIINTRFDRLLDFDNDTGTLHCESGVPLSEIIKIFLPRGWFLPTTPGTKHITIGGAIAADVHGKNHHRDGSFGDFVLELRLLLASGDELRCSPAEHADVFWATIGGMGLTGIILDARIQLIKVKSAYIDVTHQRTRDLDEALETFAASDADYRYSVAWVDCLATGKSLGRGVLMLGNECAAADLPTTLRDEPLHLLTKRKKSVPCYFPQWVLNAHTVRAFNQLFYMQHKNCRKIVDLDSYFYPLDSLRNWNRIYGKRGFIQYQALFPPETSRRGLVQLLESLASSRKASFLAVLKATGAANQGMLSFPFPGHTLALDLPNNGTDLINYVRQLDKIVLEHGGRLYLAKDATTSAATLRRMYSRLGEFQRVKARIDPQNKFASSLARRLGIIDSHA